MEKEKIVKLFLENGFQLSKSALNDMPREPDMIIFELKKIKPRPFIVTDEHIRKILATKIFEPIKIETVKEFTINKTPLCVNDYVKHLLSRYEKIKSILIKQSSLKWLVSINKITPRTMHFSIIGIVREKNDECLSVEDPTGETSLYFDESMKEDLNYILLDDIIGFQCEKIKEKYYIRKLIYPDVLSSRGVTKTKEDILITFIVLNRNLSDEQTKKLTEYLSNLNPPPTVFIFDENNSHFLNNLFPNSSLVKVSLGISPKLFQLGEIKILTLPHPFFNDYSTNSSENDVLTSILKRRELVIGNSHVFNVHEDFVLSETPDIIVSNFGETTYLNYKGSTLISNSNPEKGFTINLRTRNVEQFSL